MACKNTFPRFDVMTQLRCVAINKYAARFLLGESLGMNPSSE